jgi:hypothetical protein
MRERLEQRAAENGRAMSAEVVEAIEKHLLAADRVTQLWEAFGKHKENIEAIPVILSAITEIEVYLAGLGVPDATFSMAEVPRVVTVWTHQQEQDVYDAYVATLPLVTADQVQIIRDRLKELADLSKGRVYWSEDMFLASMKVSQIEDIRGFERAIKHLETRKQFLPPA